MNTNDLKRTLDDLIFSNLPRKEDRLGQTYSHACTVETYSKKLRENLKSEVFLFGRSQTILERSISLVSQTGIMNTTSLFKGSMFDTSILVKQGPSYVDLDVLKEELGVSDRKWEAAVSKATKRRNPSVTISVAEIVKPGKAKTKGE